MKRFFVLILILTICVPVYTQSFRLVGGIGSNFSYGKNSGLNFVLNRYNETRQGQAGAAKVTKPMSDIKTTLGLSWQLGFMISQEDGPALYAGISRAGRSAETFANVTDINGNTGKRYVELTNNSVNFDVAFGKNTGFGYLLIGGSTDIITTKTFTKINTNDYAEITNDRNVGFTLFLDASVFVTRRFSIGLRPYMQLPFLKTSFADLNRTINSATYFRDNFDDSNSSMSNVGLQLMVRVFTVD